MIEKGYIRIFIDKKVYFEYYKLKKPKKENFYSHNWRGVYPVKVFHSLLYKNEMKEYEASKQLIKVEHIFYRSKKDARMLKLPHLYLINNQPCKAEVNGTAVIIEFC